MGQTRLELAGIELAQLRHSTILVVIWSVLAALLAVSGSLFVSAAILLYFWNTAPFLALLGCALFYLILAGLAVRKVLLINESQPPLFEATLAELQKDREALRSQTSQAGGRDAQ